MSDIPTVRIIQSVAILIDGNNIERSLHSMTKDDNCMINFDNLIPKLLKDRGLSRLIYFREGNQISSKLADRLLTNYMGSVVPCHKSADIPLSISATQIARKVDTIIILSGDSDYVELVRHLKGEGVRIEIAAVKATTAQILIDEADHFVEITVEDSFSLGPKRSSSKRPTAKSRPTSTRKSSASKSPSTKESNTTAKKNDGPKQSEKSNATTSRSNPKSNSSNKKKEAKETVKPKKSNDRKSTKKAPQASAKNKPKKTKTSTPKASSMKKASSNSSRAKKSQNTSKKKGPKIEPVDDFSY